MFAQHEFRARHAPRQVGVNRVLILALAPAHRETIGLDLRAVEVVFDADPRVGRHRLPIAAVRADGGEGGIENHVETVVGPEFAHDRRRPNPVGRVVLPEARRDFVQHDPVRARPGVGETADRVVVDVGGLRYGGVRGVTGVERVVVDRKHVAIRCQFPPVIVRAHRQEMAVGCGPVQVIELGLAKGLVRGAMAAKRGNVELQVRRGGGVEAGQRHQQRAGKPCMDGHGGKLSHGKASVQNAAGGAWECSTLNPQRFWRGGSPRSEVGQVSGAGTGATSHRHQPKTSGGTERSVHAARRHKFDAGTA
jgi:hypothetical protein